MWHNINHLRSRSWLRRQLWDVKAALSPIPACCLKDFKETAALFVAKIMDGMPQNKDRFAPFETAGDFVSAESCYEALENFPFKQREEYHFSLFHQGKKGFVFDVVPFSSRDNRFQC